MDVMSPSIIQVLSPSPRYCSVKNEVWKSGALYIVLVNVALIAVVLWVGLRESEGLLERGAWW